jgi:uncharacterized membrane protein
MRDFVDQIDHDRVHAAIKSAEEGNSADIVLYISHRAAPEPLPAAHAVFSKLKLDRAKDDNSLLIFISPKSRTFAAIGGQALHVKVGQAWWDEMVAKLTSHFKQGRFTDGLLEILAEAGDALRKHFPAKEADRTGQVDIVEDP